MLPPTYMYGSWVGRLGQLEYRFFCGLWFHFRRTRVKVCVWCSCEQNLGKEVSESSFHHLQSSVFLLAFLSPSSLLSLPFLSALLSLLLTSLPLPLFLLLLFFPSTHTHTHTQLCLYSTILLLQIVFHVSSKHTFIFTRTRSPTP